MCPEPGLISSWVDGEVPSPWKERLQAHLEVCPSCSARAKAYQGLSGALGLDGAEAAALARIETRLGARLASRLDSSLEAADGLSPATHPGSPLWRRGLVVPLPLAAVAALAIVFLLGLTATSLMGRSRPAVQSLAATELVPQSTSSGSMEALVHYLEAQNAQVNLTIQLPSGATFSSSGKPVVMKAEEASFPATNSQGLVP